MRIQDIIRVHKNKKSKTVGRGSKRGKTSGRGTKGQNARAGHKKRPEIRDTIKKLPKLRGRGVNGLRTIQRETVVVNLGRIDKAYSANMMVTPRTLRDRKILNTTSSVFVKILGDGELTKALIFKDCYVSDSAKAKIEKAGGSVAKVVMSK